MRLIRFATIELTRPAPARLSRGQFNATNGVTVSVLQINKAKDVTDESKPRTTGPTVTWSYERDAAHLAVEATVACSVVVDSDGLIPVPEQARIQAEAAILEYADILAVAYQCRRTVRSPNPCVALVAEHDAERQQLGSARGLRASLPSRPRALMLPDLVPGSPLLNAIADRLDGLALLADALSEDGPVGQVHNYFRLFERAFGKGPSGCIDLLLEFLTAGPVQLGWTRDELGDWFQRLRPEVTHADRRDEYARALDVAPYLGRIEYAAYDVLLNKALWRAATPERRDVITLAAGLDTEGVLRMQREDTTVVFSWLDPFGVFPIDFNLTPNISGEKVLAVMPGYTSDEPGRYIARAKIRHDFANETETYEYEVMTEHRRPTSVRAATPLPHSGGQGQRGKKGKRR